MGKVQKGEDNVVAGALKGSKNKEFVSPHHLEKFKKKRR